MQPGRSGVVMRWRRDLHGDCDDEGDGDDDDDGGDGNIDIDEENVECF